VLDLHHYSRSWFLRQVYSAQNYLEKFITPKLFDLEKGTYKNLDIISCLIRFLTWKKSPRNKPKNCKIERKYEKKCASIFIVGVTKTRKKVDPGLIRRARVFQSTIKPFFLLFYGFIFLKAQWKRRAKIPYFSCNFISIFCQFHKLRSKRSTIKILDLSCILNPGKKPARQYPNPDRVSIFHFPQNRPVYFWTFSRIFGRRGC